MFFDSSAINIMQKDYCGFLTSYDHHKEKGKESQIN